MSAKSATLCLFLCAIPAALLAQAPIGGDQEVWTAEQLTQEVKSLKNQLAGLSTNLSETVTQVQQNNAAIRDLTSTINEELAKQQQILEAISGTDNAGRRIPKLSAIMEQSAEFRQDVSDAVHKSLKTQGDLSITNKTGSYQQIYVNKTEYGVSAGQTLTLKVPVGTVTTQLPGKSLENWTVGAPDYQENIDIIPTSTPVTVYRPLTYVNSPAPVYIEPAPAPLYYSYSYSYYSPPVVSYYVWP